MFETESEQHLHALLRAESAEDIHAACRASLGAFDELNARMVAEANLHLDCCAGCSLCCSLRIDVYPHEVFLIADHIRRHFSEQEVAALRQRLTAHSAKVLPLTPGEHVMQNIPCPLLVEGRCSVYAVRPATCRRHHSFDVSACRYTYEHPTDLQFPAAHHAELFRTLTLAMQQVVAAYRQLGVDVTIYELGTALEEALDDEGSWEGWIGHMEAFARASITPAA